MGIWWLIAGCGLTPYADLNPADDSGDDGADDEAPADPEDTPTDDTDVAGAPGDSDPPPRDTEAPDPPPPPAYTGPCPLLVEMTTLDYGIESGWRVLDDAGAAVGFAAPGSLEDNRSYVGFLQVSDGDFQVEGVDSYGDGWHGGSLRVVSNQGAVLANVALQNGQSSVFAPFSVDCIEPPQTPRTCPVRVVIETQNWASESGWKLHSARGAVLSTVAANTYANYQTYTHDTDLAEGVYVFEATDSYGDGWHTGTFTVRVNGQQVRTGTLVDGDSGMFVFPVSCP